MKQKLVFEKKDLETAMGDYIRREHADIIPMSSHIKVDINCSYNSSSDPRERQGAYITDIVAEITPVNIEPSSTPKVDPLMSHEDWNEMNDVARWKWVRDNRAYCTVHCDNDDTFMTLDSSKEEDVYFQFDWYVGWADGLFELAEAFDLPLEAV